MVVAERAYVSHGFLHCTAFLGIHFINSGIGNGYFKSNLNGNNGLRLENWSFFKEGFLHRSLEKDNLLRASTPHFLPF